MKRELILDIFCKSMEENPAEVGNIFEKILKDKISAIIENRKSQLAEHYFSDKIPNIDYDLDIDEDDDIDLEDLENDLKENFSAFAIALNEHRKDFSEVISEDSINESFSAFVKALHHHTEDLKEFGSSVAIAGAGGAAIGAGMGLSPALTAIGTAAGVGMGVATDNPNIFSKIYRTYQNIKAKERSVGQPPSMDEEVNDEFCSLFDDIVRDKLWEASCAPIKKSETDSKKKTKSSNYIQDKMNKDKKVMEESEDGNMRLLKTHDCVSGNCAKVYRKPETKEYVVKYFEKGKHLKDANSYHDDILDANGTAKEELRMMRMKKYK